MRNLAWLVAPAFGVLFAASAAGAGPAAPITPDLAEASRLIIEHTNAFRRTQRSAATTPNQRLTDAAARFAQYMARTDRYGHEADGTEPSQRARAQGYAYCMVSENIAYQFHSRGFRAPDLARRVVEGWKASPPHRRNMLNPDATDIGVALARSADSGRYYAVQMFGRPAALRIAFRIANRSATPVSYELGGQRFELPPRVTRTHEQCQVEPLTMRLPGVAEPAIIRPAAGMLYAVERAGARYRLTRRPLP